MSNRFKLIAEGLDVTPLLAKLEEKPELWTQRTERQSYPGSAHKDTETIYLRWARDQSLEGGFYCLESEDLLESLLDLTPEIGPLFQSVLRYIGCGEKPEVGRVILVKLAPHGHISEHVDEGPYADRYDRFHLCLSGTSSFYVEGEQQEMRSGELWWFNHKKAHKVHNFSHQPRIHLIIDLVAPEYRKLRGLTFQRERPHELLDEAMPIFEAHYKEIAHYQDIPLDINEAAYMHLEESGLLRCFTARYNGDLVGYCVFMVRPNLRYSTSIQAVQDILYIEQGKRGPLFGKRLIEYCEDRLKAEGVQVVYQHSKASPEVLAAIDAIPKRHDTGLLFEYMGYTLIDLIHGKRLDK